jgi:hypothetical protein
MSEPEPSDEIYTYLLGLSRTRVSVITFLAGFTFTVLGIFLNQLPDPSAPLSQITLFLLTLLFEFFLFLSVWQISIIISCAPARIVGEAYSGVFRHETGTFSILMFIALSVLGMSVMLMFLLWNLLYLAIASCAVWIVVIIASYRIIQQNIQRVRTYNAQQTKKD